jgi:hypothetical protein
MRKEPDGSRWKLIRRTGNGYGLYRCACGTEKQVNYYSVRNGRSQSCGCLQQEVRLRTDNKYRRHGMIGTPTYRSWKAMLSRCTNPKNKDYARYGGRGVSVCDPWRYDFNAFHRDMGDRMRGTSLERIDVNGNYVPGNCEWATSSQQSRNKRNSVSLTVEGRTKTLKEWSELYGVGQSTIRERLSRGWSSGDAVSVPALRKGLDFLTQERATAARRAFQPPKNPRSASPAGIRPGLVSTCRPAPVCQPRANVVRKKRCRDANDQGRESPGGTFGK